MVKVDYLMQQIEIVFDNYGAFNEFNGDPQYLLNKLQDVYFIVYDGGQCAYYDNQVVDETL